MTRLDSRTQRHLPLDPVDIMFRSTRDARSAESADLVLAQFDVGRALRYQREPGKTFCNIFAWDVAGAFGVELPHWILADGTPAKPGAAGAHETLTNELRDRLVAGAWGWKPMDPVPAAQNAARGRPTIAIWRNHSGPGHVAWLEPNSDQADIYVAQAGALCGRHMPLETAFGKHRLGQVLFFGQP